MPSTIPSGGITLHNAAESTDASKSGTSSAILFKLDDSVLRDLKGAPKDDLRFVTGSVPVCLLPW